MTCHFGLRWGFDSFPAARQVLETNKVTFNWEGPLQSRFGGLGGAPEQLGDQNGQVTQMRVPIGREHRPPRCPW